VRPELPAGTVTFLFTDVEGSTRLLHELGAEGYAQALAEHRRVVRDAFSRHGGVEVDTQGDAFFVAFPTAPGALAAAREATEALSSGPIRVRVGLHTGTPLVTEEGYVGADVHRAARIAAAGHGGQVLVSAATGALVERDGLVDLGEHRLKDLSAPERLYQLGGGGFPPLKTLYQTNLPIPATPFLGRERELAEIGDLLARADVRLLTLTGPGGSGKTRLGLQAAADAADAFPGGVWWVPLAPLRDPELVLETAASALGAKDGLAEHIGDESLLLLLDNFEHLIDAADGLAELLARCPNLQLVVTSRELLALPGEQAYPVPPLEPDEGAELFLARARAAKPDFQGDGVVPELCERLDNLPLALELAAARVRVLSPEQLLERLSRRLDLLKAGRGVDPRQQTLRATIEWSHELLDGDEQRLFARLSVFRGGWTLETAEEVCEADLDVVQSLVDKSLVHVREGDRFWMLETIREYAEERLEHSDEADELRRRHAEHFLALAEEAEPHLRADPKEWLDRLEHESANLWAALDAFETTGATQQALRLAAAVSRFWYLRGYIAEGHRRLERLLAADDRPTKARADALNASALRAHDPETASRLEEALKLHRALGNEWGAANSQFSLGQVAAARRDWATARDLFDESAGTLRALGDEHYAMVVTRNLASMHDELGDSARARSLHEENLRRARELRNERVEATTLQALGDYAIDEGRLDEAISMLRRSLALDRDIGDLVGVADALGRLALALGSAGKAERAVQLVARADALYDEIGTRPRWVPEIIEEARARARAQIDEAAFGAAWQRGSVLTLDEAVELALDESD
jgi:predicted ATPase